MKSRYIKIICLAAVLAALGFFFYYLRLSDYFTLEALKKNHNYLQYMVQNHYLFSVLVFIGIFSILIACAMPIIIPLALVGGFLYGVIGGVAYAGISCLIGSILSFLVLRYVVAGWVKEWHNERIDKFNEQIHKYGYSYLLMLHFLSIIPLFVINLLAAMANVPFLTVIWVTIVGTFPLNFLCSLAGQQLGTINSFGDIFSPTIITLLALLACVAFAPMLIKKVKGSLRV